jgi:hypothetical protein
MKRIRQKYSKNCLSAGQVHLNELRTTITTRHPSSAKTGPNPGAFVPAGAVEVVGAATVVIVAVGTDFCRTKEVIPLSCVAGGTISLSQQVWSHSTKVAALHDG